MAIIDDREQSAVDARSSNMRGIIAMVISMACFVSSDTLIKIVGRDLPVGQIMFLRGLFSTVLIFPLVVVTGSYDHIIQALTPIVGLRAASEVAATILFFTGLMFIPFADAAAIGQFAPLAVTAGAAVFLNEPVGWRRWLAALVGLLGVLLIIRPGSGAFNPAAILIVLCVFCASARDLITRMMGSGIPILVLILISAVATMLTGLAAALIETWPATTWVALASLALSAVGVSAGYYGSVVAMRSGEISVIAPFRYTSMLFALLWGYVLFSEVPDQMTWIGIAIVIAAGFYTLHRESVRKREAAATRA